MHLVQLFLPLADNRGEPIDREAYDALRSELMNAFGGVTVFARAPARGLWKPADDEPANADDIVIYEVMAQELDRAWWHALRQRLEAQFAQETIVVRVMDCEAL
jgi:hypothetical protein